VFAEVVRAPQAVADIARRFTVSRPAVSQHLKVLADARLVTATKVGRQRIYSARTDGLAALRADLDRFWTDALTNFKQLAEHGDTEGADDERDD
jgi:DNA-binding transcriptional ArsR family regulator